MILESLIRAYPNEISYLLGLLFHSLSNLYQTTQ